jgi:hypothetical protein
MTDKELRELAERATPGFYQRDGTIVSSDGEQIDIRIGRGFHNWLTVKTKRAEADAAYLEAASPANIIALLDQKAALMERIAALRVGLEQIACLDERNSPAQRTAERLLMNDEQALAADDALAARMVDK